MPVIRGLNVNVTKEDIEAGQAAGLTANEVTERVINAELDACGVPRKGREVKVTENEKRELTIDIVLPHGWTMLAATVFTHESAAFGVRVLAGVGGDVRPGGQDRSGFPLQRGTSCPRANREAHSFTGFASGAIPFVKAMPSGEVPRHKYSVTSAPDFCSSTGVGGAGQ
jgi:hypothetical protein